MADILTDQFAFWIFLVPGFILLWSFRYFTNSNKRGDFEFFGLGIAGGFLILLLYGLLVRWGAIESFKDETPLYAAGFMLSILSYVAGLFCAQVSKWRWFRKIVNFLKSNWLSGEY